MKRAKYRNLLSYLLCTVFFILGLLSVSYKLKAQELIRYDKEHLTAKIHYNRFLHGVHHKLYNNELDIKIPDYPAIGSYSPTMYGLQGIKSGVGVCNYIYIPTNDLLKPGQQYHFTITVKLPKEYNRMPYYQEYFGVALSSKLFVNHFGLWAKHFIPLNIQTGREIVTLDMEFRPLCTSKYVLLGVFQGPTMDEPFDFARLYDFELYSLVIEKSKNPNNDFYYVCDGFVEKNLNKKWDISYDTDTIYFDSGSAKIKNEYKAILDSIPHKLRTVQDLVSLYAYTDKKGSDSDNINLGSERNNAVRDALIKRGIDSIRILMTNYGETKSSDEISQKNRKVEIDVNLGKLYQKSYTEALQAAKNDDFGMANKKINSWLRYVPNEYVIYALFDCWGEGRKSKHFKLDLLKRIKSKFYKAKKLKFILDSLYCENIKDDGLSWYLSMNQLPTYDSDCVFKTDFQKNEKLIQKVEEIYSEYGFPLKKDVGKRANSTLPGIILKSEDLDYLQKYLSIFKDACEKQQISWDFYAQLYDKISVKLTGFQRYGTIKSTDKNGKMSFTNPIEDIEKLREYRKQVKLPLLQEEIIKETKKNQKKLDTFLVKTLNKIYQSDQKYRLKTKSIEQKYGRESEKLKELWILIHKTDSLNLIKVKEILDHRGWLGSQIVGDQGNTTLFLVIQHAADIDTQLKYLPVMRQAVKNGNAKASELALLEDRIAINQGKKQIYGSQIGRDPQTGKYYVLPLIEPEKVNERRSKIGLDKIEDYVKHWGIKWDIEELKK